MGDYAQFCFKNKKLVVHKTMKEIETMLCKKCFLRIHKSYIVNQIDFVDGHCIKLSDEYIPIGKSYKYELDKALNKS